MSCHKHCHICDGTIVNYTSDPRNTLQFDLSLPARPSLLLALFSNHSSAHNYEQTFITFSKLFLLSLKTIHIVTREIGFYLYMACLYIHPI